MSNEPRRKHLYEGLGLDADEGWREATKEIREAADTARARRMLSDCVVLGGYGPLPDVRSRVDLLFDEDGVTVYRSGRDPLDQRSPVLSGVIDAETRIDVGGRGDVKSGGGMIGGGFGLQGAAIGIAAASVLNALTTRTSTETIVSVTTLEWQVIVLYTGMNPQQTRIELAPIFGRIAAAGREGNGRKSSPAEAVKALKDLAELRDAEVLSEEEFAVAKQKILDAM